MLENISEPIIDNDNENAQEIVPENISEPIIDIENDQVKHKETSNINLISDGKTGQRLEDFNIEDVWQEM